MSSFQIFKNDNFREGLNIQDTVSWSKKMYRVLEEIPDCVIEEQLIESECDHRFPHSCMSETAYRRLVTLHAIHTLAITDDANGQIITNAVREEERSNRVEYRRGDDEEFGTTSFGQQYIALLKKYRLCYLSSGGVAKVSYSRAVTVGDNWYR